MQAPDPKLDQLLRTAIEQTRLLRLRYRNKDRIVEPHDYGQHNGVIKLLTWQIGGSSTGAGWKPTRSPMHGCSTRPSQVAAPHLLANTINGTNSFCGSNRPIIRRAESLPSAVCASLPKAHCVLRLFHSKSPFLLRGFPNYEWSSFSESGQEYFASEAPWLAPQLWFAPLYRHTKFNFRPQSEEVLSRRV